MKQILRLTFHAFIIATALAACGGDGKEEGGGGGQGTEKSRGALGVKVTIQYAGYEFEERGKKSGIVVYDEGGPSGCSIFPELKSYGFVAHRNSFDLSIRNYTGPGQYEASGGLKEWQCSMIVDAGELSGSFSCTCTRELDFSCAIDNSSKIEGEFTCLGEFKPI